MTHADDARAAALAAEPLRPAGPSAGAAASTVDSVRDVLAQRGLLRLLVRREIKARYKDSALGLVWTLIRPLVMLVVYAVAVGKFLEASKSIPGYPVYIFAGLTAWGLFNDLVISGTSSVVANGGLVKKVYFPREIFPLATAGSALFNFAVQLVILVLAMLVVGVPSAGNLLYFPLSFAIVYLRDVQYLVEVALMVLFWASPIVYDWTKVADNAPGWLTEFYLANPVTLAILGFQRAFWAKGAGLPLPTDFTLRLWICLGASIGLLWIGQRVFARLQGNFAQEL